jgi:DNA polymerase III subunit alpha
VGFYSLHNHTQYSNIRFLDSINRASEMIDKAIRLGFSGIAFTEHEALSGGVSILKERDRIKADHPDFKIIFGNEIYLIGESEIKNTKDYYHFILLAKDIKGWEQLRKLSSRAWNRGYNERGIMRVPTTYQDVEEIVGSDKGHIIASSACIGGRLGKNILAHDVSGANQFVKWCIETFGKENFFLEIQPSDAEEQIIVNQTILKFSKHYDVPFIVTTDSHYLDKDDLKFQSAFLNSKQSGDRETEKFYKYTYIMEEQEMIDILKLGISEEDAGKAIQNTEIVGNLIEEFDFRHSTIVPEVKLPEFELERTFYHKGYEYIDKYYDSPYDQDRFLIHQIEEGIKDKNIVMDEEKYKRIETELDVLWFISERLGQRLSAYLILTKDMEDTAWKVSLNGCGRGSACGEYVNYLIGITQVNPLDYGLNWWRFLNKERLELPDIDGDYQPEKKEEIVKLLREKYGEDNVLNCATFRTESLKSAILTIGRGLGYNNDDMQALAALVPAHRGQTYNLKECLEGDEEKGYEPVPNFADKLNVYPGLLDGVRKIEGISTNASIHASALYVFNNGYEEYNALMRAPNGTKITAFNMHDTDSLSGLKMDILFTDAMSKMAKCLDLLLKDNQIEWQGSLRKTYDKYLHPDVIDTQNPQMWEQMANGKILDLFQFMTPVGGTCIKKAKPTTVRQLAEINSIMRLQADSGEQPIDRYVRFRNNINEWYKEMDEAGLTKSEQEILKKYLAPSFGVSGSQEVLMEILMDPNICNFTLGEANLARKAIAKKQAKKIIQLKKDFYEKGEKTPNAKDCA